MGIFSRMFGEGMVNATPRSIWDSGTENIYRHFEQKYEKMRREGKRACALASDARAIGAPYPWATEAEEDNLRRFDHRRCL